MQPLTSSPPRTTAENAQTAVSEALYIQLDDLTTDGQVRKVFDEEKLRHLAESLRTEGQLQPILVYRDQDRGKYVVLAGERRLRAARLIDLPGLDCIVYARKLTPSETSIVQIIENTLREGLDPIEQATGYRAIMEQDGLSQAQLADRLHLHASSIGRALALLELPEDLQAEIRGGGLVPGVARELARLPEESRRREILARVRAEGLTAAETNKLVSKLLKAKTKPGRKTKPAKIMHRLGGFEAVLTPKRITLSLLPSKKSRTHEDTITALEALIHKLREDAAKSQSVSV